MKREGGAKVRSGWGKKGRVRPINYTRGKKRGATTVGGEGKSEEGRIVGSRDINGGGCAEGGGSLFTGFSDPPPLGNHLTLAGVIEPLANISHEISPNTSTFPGTKGELESERCTREGFVDSLLVFLSWKNIRNRPTNA